MMFFYDFPLIFKVFINIHEYKNKIICIFDHGLKVLQSLDHSYNSEGYMTWP